MASAASRRPVMMCALEPVAGHLGIGIAGRQLHVARPLLRAHEPARCRPCTARHLLSTRRDDGHRATPANAARRPAYCLAAEGLGARTKADQNPSATLWLSVISMSVNPALGEADGVGAADAG